MIIKKMTLNYLNSRLVGILRTKPGTSSENAISAIKIAFESGVSAVEITSNSNDWQKILTECLKENLNIGVGSVKNIKIAKEAVSLGARFLVCPGLFEDVILEAKENKIPILPGVYLGSEALKAKFLEIKDQKFFPANVKTDEELFKAIKEPFRDEFEELEKINCKIAFFDLNGGYKLDGKYEIVNSPTEFYRLYLRKEKLKDCSIIIKLPQGKIGFERIYDLNDVENRVRTYAVGGVGEKNMEEVLTKYKAYGVCPGSGMFNAEAILNGDFERVKSDVMKYVMILRGIH